MSIITQLRSYRIIDIAIFDVVMTILGGYLLVKYIVPYFYPDFSATPQTYGYSIVGMFILGIMVHHLLGIPTMLNYYLGMSEKPKRE